MLHYELTKEQYNQLLGLAYFIADVNYIRKKYGVEDPEHEKAHKNVLYCFDQLDKLQVPFWVQNCVICYFEVWRRYLDTYFTDFLKKHNITVKGACV